MWNWIQSHSHKGRFNNTSMHLVIYIEYKERLSFVVKLFMSYLTWYDILIQGSCVDVFCTKKNHLTLWLQLTSYAVSIILSWSLSTTCTDIYMQHSVDEGYENAKFWVNLTKLNSYGISPTQFRHVRWCLWCAQLRLLFLYWSCCHFLVQSVKSLDDD